METEIIDALHEITNALIGVSFILVGLVIATLLKR